MAKTSRLKKLLAQYGDLRLVTEHILRHEKEAMREIVRTRLTRDYCGTIADLDAEVSALTDTDLENVGR